MTPKKTKSSFGRKLLFIAAIILISFIALELLVRCVLLFNGTPQRPSEIRDEIATLTSLMTHQVPMPEKALDEDFDEGGQFVLHPYWGFDIRGTFQQHEHLLNKIKYDQSENKRWIFVTGGSVAERFTKFSWDAFSARLRKDPRFEGQELVAINTARGGFKEPQQAAIVSYLFGLGLKPDCVINIDGFNEVALGRQCIENGVFPAYPPMERWALLVKPTFKNFDLIDQMVRIRNCQKTVSWMSQNFIAFRLHYSGLLSRLCLMWMKKLQSDQYSAYKKSLQLLEEQAKIEDDPSLTGPSLDGDGGKAMDLIIENWFESSLSIDAMCRTRRIPYIHVLQPTLKYEGSKPLSDEEKQLHISPDWHRGVVSGYPLLRKAGRRLAKYDVPFYDLTMLFEDVTETLYYDCCHFAGTANGIFGKAVAECLLDRLKPEDSPRSGSGETKESEQRVDPIQK